MPEPTACECPWYGHYKGFQKGLAEWTGRDIDPHSKGPAEKALTRMKQAIDNGVYDPHGERQSLGDERLFRDFVDERKTQWATVRGLSANSMDAMLNVIVEKFGNWPLSRLVESSVEIERWLNEQQQERKWSDNTWNRYRKMLNRLFNGR